ncbi:hypothetical protein INS49_010733 [Diaporthe citri]|uniref:uncharacterized protein n=1 Tax=Diaporthe citri TaxID=83186 RepID=UPI001C808EE1|nr:uncharacterized protein INS49_010733 [Diaporthe citri]KAG6362501.1 hypothetical protein INS49_010733 [Diaporthe citri]
MEAGWAYPALNLAVTLCNILQVAWGSKPYVDDLAPDSAILMMMMNDDFRVYAYDLRLWSFFKTVPMTGLNRLVVDKVSATLGFGNEEMSFMDADHRNVCKFRNQQDPNYRKLRNSLCSAIDMMKTDSALPREMDHAGRATSRSKPRSFLLSTDMDSLEDDLATLEELKTTVSFMGSSHHNYLRGFDPRLYVNTILDEMAYKDAAKLVERILAKANGSILWTRLVVQDLEMVFTEEEVDGILNDIPDDLFSVYERILRSIESDRRRARLAKSILT